MNRTERDYQTRCIEAVKAAFLQGLTGVAVEIFTGGGKGYIIARIAELVRQKGGRCLVLVNRDNLVDQLFESVANQGLFPSREQGAHHATPLSDMVVASVQTLQGKRLLKWPKNQFKLIIVDEAHFSAAATFGAVLNHFTEGKVFHTFFTATLERHDKKPLWKGIQKKVFSMPLTEGIAEGWLVPFVLKELPVPITITDRENTTKRWSDAEEEAVFSRDSYLPRLFTEAAAESYGHKALMFWPGCKASEEAAKAFRLDGIDSRHVDGYMSKTEIGEILEWFKSPGAKACHNADLLSYGYDNPSIDLVGIMRLSRSLPMLKQRIGRATRPFEANVDNYPTSELRRAAISASPKPTFKILDLMLQMGEAQSSFATCGELITSDKDEAEYIRKARKPGVQIDLNEMGELLRVKRSDDEKALTKLAQDAANAAEKLKLRGKEPYYGHILKRMRHNGKPASEPALRYLKRLGYTGPSHLTAQACFLITEEFKTHRAKRAFQLT